jgi:hypothetical protein
MKLTESNVFGRSRYTPFEMTMRRQRLNDFQRHNNAEIMSVFTELVTAGSQNPAFTLTIFGLKEQHVIRCAAWTGTGSHILAEHPIHDQLLAVFEEEVRPRHNCAYDNAEGACREFWTTLIHGTHAGECGPMIFRGCGWRYEDANGRVLEKN